MRLQRVILRVSNMDESVAFWQQKVGLTPVVESPAFTFFDAGAAQILLNALAEVPAPGLTEIVLEVEDVRADYEAMAARGVPFEVELRPVTVDGEKELLASHFRDPDGNLASLTGWVDAT